MNEIMWYLSFSDLLILWYLSWLVMVFRICCLVLLEDNWGTSETQSHNSTGDTCAAWACLAPALPSIPRPTRGPGHQWLLEGTGELGAEKQEAGAGEKRDCFWVEASSPWFMLHCPIWLHLLNTNSKIRWLNISKCQSQSIQLQAWDFSELRALCNCTAYIFMKHGPACHRWVLTPRPGPHSLIPTGLSASALVFCEGSWSRHKRCQLMTRIPKFSQVIPVPLALLCVSGFPGSTYSTWTSTSTQEMMSCTFLMLVSASLSRSISKCLSS